MIDRELSLLGDARVVAHIRTLLIEPAVTLRVWPYGRDQERFPCWTVLRHPPSNTGIAYCEHGFGPHSPWGLVSLKGDEAIMSIGMDSEWFSSFLRTYFDSQAATDLAIWRVFKTEGGTKERLAISNEDSWDATWANVMALRESDPLNQYDCDTTVQLKREYP